MLFFCFVNVNNSSVTIHSSCWQDLHPLLRDAPRHEDLHEFPNCLHPNLLTGSMESIQTVTFWTSTVLTFTACSTHWQHRATACRKHFMSVHCACVKLSLFNPSLPGWTMSRLIHRPLNYISLVLLTVLIQFDLFKLGKMGTNVQVD